LETVAVIGLLADDVEHGVDELGALSVVPLGPVVACAGLAKHEVVRAEDLAVGPCAHGVHGAGLQVHENGSRHEAAARRLVVVDVHALQLQVRRARVPPRRVDAVLVAHHLPELGPDLVPALPALDVQDLPHLHRLQPSREKFQVRSNHFDVTTNPRPQQIPQKRTKRDRKKRLNRAKKFENPNEFGEQRDVIAALPRGKPDQIRLIRQSGRGYTIEEGAGVCVRREEVDAKWGVMFYRGGGRWG
jgi:hypothetical protein